MPREILICFYVPDANTDEEALAEVEKVLPYDPDSDPRHGVESWTPVKVEVETHYHDLRTTT